MRITTFVYIWIAKNIITGFGIVHNLQIHIIFFFFFFGKKIRNNLSKTSIKNVIGKVKLVFADKNDWIDLSKIFNDIKEISCIVTTVLRIAGW